MGDSGEVMASNFEPFEFRMAPHDKDSGSKIIRVVLDIFVMRKDVDVFLVKYDFKREVFADPAESHAGGHKSVQAQPAGLQDTREVAPAMAVMAKASSSCEARTSNDDEIEDAARVVRSKLEELRQRTRRAVATLEHPC